MSAGRGRLAEAAFFSCCSQAADSAGLLLAGCPRLLNYAHISFGHQLLTWRFHLDQLSENCGDIP